MVSQLSNHVKAVYKATRLRIPKDAWPPEQPKEFTPLVLLHHEDEHNIKETTTITKVLCSGAITDLIPATSSEPPVKRPRVPHYDGLGEALKASKTTTEVSEIIAPLEVSNNDPQMILIEGAPGIGKTILLKHIAYKWAEQRLLQKYELVLLVYLRDLVLQKISSLKELFQYFCEHHIEDDDITICIKHVSSNDGKFLTFLLDGYDELPKEFRENSLIADILNRKVLPNCGLVVSSRPHTSVHLHKDAKLQVKILGFTEEQRQHYIKHSLSDQSQIRQLTTYLQQQIIINSLCYVPLNIALLLFLYKQDVHLPNNATELYSVFICLIICQNLSKYGITINPAEADINNLPEPCGKFIHQLSKLSLQALNDDQLIFTLEQIKQWCPQVEKIPGALNAFGLLQAIEHVSIFQKITTFHFLHSSIQEFLAANHITTLTPDEESCILEKYFWCQRHSNMFTMYITLTKGQRPSFKKFLTGGDNTNTVAIHSKFLDNELNCIHLYRCFNEASENDRVCKTIERKFSDGVVDLYFAKLSTNDIENIAILLTCSSIKQWKVLCLGGCYILDAGMFIIHRILSSSSITIEGLKLYGNDLSSTSDGCLADIVITCRVKVLNVNYNKTIGQTEEFFPKILSPSSFIHTLVITGTNLTSKVAITIFSLLREKTKLKVLHMANNIVTDEAHNIIAKTLQLNNTLEYLNIHGNKISAEASQVILHHLRHNNTLTDLFLPGDYSDNDSKQILRLQDIVNEERKCRGYDAKLTVKFCYN